MGIHVQGDTSCWSKPPVDIKTKVMFWPGQVRAGQNGTFVLMSMGGLNQRDVSPCIWRQQNSGIVDPLHPLWLQNLYCVSANLGYFWTTFCWDVICGSSHLYCIPLILLCTAYLQYMVHLLTVAVHCIYFSACTFVDYTFVLTCDKILITSTRKKLPTCIKCMKTTLIWYNFDIPLTYMRIANLTTGRHIT